MEAFWIVVAILVAFLIVFFVVALRFPSDFTLLLERLTSFEMTKDGVKVGLVAAAVEARGGERPRRRDVQTLVGDIPEGKRVLWVDDRPANNRAEIQALRALSFDVDLATTNAEAIAYATTNHYDVVLSDIGRALPEEPTAGLDLPAELQAVGVDAPLAFYVGQATSDTTAGGASVFDTPRNLLAWVDTTLKGQGA